VPPTTKRLFDVGCGTGALGHRVKQEIGAYVAGVTHADAEAALAREIIDQVVVVDLNDLDLPQFDLFDCVICSHVLEHLLHPEEILKWLRGLLAAEGTLIIALPNVLFWRQRLAFLRGKFRYTRGGLMDHTHYRFFDWVTARQLLIASGYSVIEARADGTFPLSRYLFGFGKWLDHLAVKTMPGLFGFQFIFVCRPNAE